MLLYQSSIWRYINEEVFKRNVWEVNWRSSTVWGLKRTKRLMNVDLNMYQLLGIIDQLEGAVLSEEVKYLSNKILTSWKDIYLQVGFVAEVGRCPSKMVRKKRGCGEIVFKKQEIEDLMKSIGLKKSFYQNMPEATVEINLSHNEYSIWGDISATSRRYIRKYQKQGFNIEEIKNRSDILSFGEIWEQMAKKKNISIWPKDVLVNLVDVLKQKKYGSLFGARTPKGDIAFGAVMIFLDDRVVYLYGALNPLYAGSSYWFMWKFILWAKQQGFKIFDLLGVSSILSLETHKWSDVSRFKYSLGGEHVEYVGNFDIVHNTLFYEALKIFRNLK